MASGDLTIYLAGPISGNSYDDVSGYFTDMTSILVDLGYAVLHPMLGKEVLRTEIKLKASGYGNPESTNHAILERDKWMVSQSDIVLCNLMMGKDMVSIGSVMELAWACMMNKLTIVVMQKDNIHQHAFVIEAADIIYEDIYDAIRHLKKLLTKKD